MFLKQFKKWNKHKCITPTTLNISIILKKNSRFAPGDQNVRHKINISLPVLLLTKQKRILKFGDVLGIN